MVDPYANALHAFAGKRRPSGDVTRVARLARLRRRALARGPRALSPSELRHLLSDADSLLALHREVWRLAGRPDLPGGLARPAGRVSGRERLAGWRSSSTSSGSRPPPRTRTFARGCWATSPRKLAKLGARGLTLHLSDRADVADVLRARISKLAAPVSGLVSFWLDSADERAPLERVLAEATSRLAGYLVVESVPLRNTTHPAPLGRRTPGVVMLALIERPERLAWEDVDRATGMGRTGRSRWRRSARSCTCATWSCARSRRSAALGGDRRGGIPHRGGHRSDALVQGRGLPETLKRNVARMVESCRAFLDLDRVESHPMSEYRLMARPGE